MPSSRNQAALSVAGRAPHGKVQPRGRRIAVWYGVMVLAFPPFSAWAQGPETTGELARSQPVAAPSPAGGYGEFDVAALRSETLERLKVYQPTISTGASVPPSASASTAPAIAAPAAGAAGAAALASPLSDSGTKKTLPMLLQDRVRLLNEYEAATIALQKTTHPDPSPDQEAAEARAELRRLRDVLAQATQSPEALLPQIFRGHSTKVSSALGSEMKDAIEAAGNELKEWKTKLENLRAETAKWKSLANARRSARDSLFQRVTALTAKSSEYKSAVTDASSGEERRVAQERLINFECQSRVETLRLRVVEGELALETKMAELRDLRAEIFRTHVQIANKTLAPMQARYRTVAEDQDRDLTKAKVDEENKARVADDPLERFRARRTAELLALESLVNRSEQALVISPSPSYEEQKTKADRADFDYANIKELLDDGKVSRLDAFRLNNEFRRIGPERDRLIKNELAAIEAQLQFYEDTLTTVELELLQTSLHDRFEHDLLRERLPASRWTEGEILIADLEAKHRALLLRRQRALEKLSEAASHTHVQVSRRLRILDQEYGFIRTTIFWVRDQEPIGPLTLKQGAREFNGLINGLLRLVKEIVKPGLWGQPSGEFMAIAAALLASPIGFDSTAARARGADQARSAGSPNLSVVRSMCGAERLGRFTSSCEWRGRGHSCEPCDP